MVVVVAAAAAVVRLRGERPGPFFCLFGGGLFMSRGDRGFWWGGETAVRGCAADAHHRLPFALDRIGDGL